MFSGEDGLWEVTTLRPQPGPRFVPPRQDATETSWGLEGGGVWTGRPYLENVRRGRQLCPQECGRVGGHLGLQGLFSTARALRWGKWRQSGAGGGGRGLEEAGTEGASLTRVGFADCSSRNSRLQSAYGHHHWTPRGPIQGSDLYCFFM